MPFLMHVNPAPSRTTETDLVDDWVLYHGPVSHSIRFGNTAIAASCYPNPKRRSKGVWPFFVSFGLKARANEAWVRHGKTTTN
jgi:hypothetical protein